MTDDTESATNGTGPTEAELRLHDAATIERMREAVAGSTPWHRAVLAAIAEWRSPSETLPDGRHLCYLTGGEAFDWVTLAGRLVEELDGEVSNDDRETLLFGGRLPEQLSEDEFRELVGPAKYRAHLNYLYGVRVEEALHLAVEEELHKELRSSALSMSASIDEGVFTRIYSKSRAELFQLYREETSAADFDEGITLTELREFVYWLFKFRVRRGEPARVASDTRKGIAQLSRIEQQSRFAAPFAEPQIDDAAVIEARVRTSV